MISREILMKIRQIELRTNRLVNASARSVEPRIPTGFRPKAQGCEERATLGQRPPSVPNRNAVATIPDAIISYGLCQNPVGVLCDVHSFTQGSFATLGWRPESRWDSLNLTAPARSTSRIAHHAARPPRSAFRVPHSALP